MDSPLYIPSGEGRKRHQRERGQHPARLLVAHHRAVLSVLSAGAAACGAAACHRDLHTPSSVAPDVHSVRARLRISSFGASAPPAAHPYLKNVYLDGSESSHIERWQATWRITDSSGRTLLDPYSSVATPLQLKPSPVPGSAPSLFIFTPPRPGAFTVKLILTDPEDAARSAETSIIVKAINVAPTAFIQAIAGPAPPQKIPSRGRRASSGLQVVTTGTKVFLMGLGFDPNAPTPELYNPGGSESDVYGKNHDHLQRQFGFLWKLQFVPEGGQEAIDASRWLSDQQEVVHFTANAPGRYVATLLVDDHDAGGSLRSAPVHLEILSTTDRREQDGTACVACHAAAVALYRKTAHHRARVGCERCHGPADLHLQVDGNDHELKRKTTAVSLDAGVCGQCHTQYSEWEKSDHSDGMAYGHLEIPKPLLVECTRCHHARHFSSILSMASGMDVTFHEAYELRKHALPPGMPDFELLPNEGETAISCVTCHGIHDRASANVRGVRSTRPGEICQTCHREKWQNLVLTGEAGQFRSAVEYPGQDYPETNPHNTARKCLLCHTATSNQHVDDNGVRSVGGHTYRMRAAGPNGVLGGYGPGRGGPGTQRNPEDRDDILLLEPCRTCHRAADSFNRNGVQETIYRKWLALGEQLKAANKGVLPGFRPGDKCAKCHRGGTLPFVDDPGGILEDAYTNYKLIKNDRSWGVHNPAYVLRLLDDSLASLEARQSR